MGQVLTKVLLARPEYCSYVMFAPNKPMKIRSTQPHGASVTDKEGPFGISVFPIEGRHPAGLFQSEYEIMYTVGSGPYQTGLTLSGPYTSCSIAEKVLYRDGFSVGNAALVVAAVRRCIAIGIAEAVD